MTLKRRSNKLWGSRKSCASSVRSDCFSSFSVVAVSQLGHTSSIECKEIPSTLASAFASAASCRYSPAFSLMLISLGISTGQFTSFKTFAMLPASWCPIWHWLCRPDWIGGDPRIPIERVEAMGIICCAFDSITESS